MPSPESIERGSAREADVAPGTVVRAETGPGPSEGGRVAALWASVLVPPVAMLANMEVDYAAVPAACGRSEWPLHLVTLVMFALAAGAGLLGHREWRRVGRAWPGPEAGEEPRTRFLGALGALLGALFALVIAAQWLALVVLGPCD